MPSAQDRRFISLERLYDFVTDHKDDEQPLRLPKRNGYGRLCSELTEPIDRAQGFYLWGYYDVKRYWHSLYLGKVGFGKASNLRARILEELKDERWFVWLSVFTKDQVFDHSNRLFPGESHRKACERALRKEKATHIVWVPAERVLRENVLRVEADLIEAINPWANLMRPTPPNTVQEEATKIFQSFRRTIHFARKTGFDAPVKK
jgi:hypothetical protein